MANIDKNFVRDLLIHEIELREMSLTDLRLSISKLENQLEGITAKKKEAETIKLLDDRLNILRNEGRRVSLEIQMLEDACKKV